MFAIIGMGGKQYKVAAGDLIKVEKVAGEAGSTINIDNVLLISDAGKTKAGTPTVAGAVVTAEIIAEAQADKVIIFKKRRRKNSRRKTGHRQWFTVLKITGIAA